MIGQAEWRELTTAQRTPWINFHLVNIANNPTDVYEAMAIGPRRQVNFLAMAASNDAAGILDSPPEWPNMPWWTVTGNRPTPTVSIRMMWPEPATNALLNVASTPGAYIDRLYKPPRCYDTGVARRRRNLPAG